MRPLACLPDRAGSAVLHAALDEPEAAARAWREARRTTDPSPDAPSTEAHRLLPLVHRNLASTDLDEPDRTHLRDRYERTLRANEDRVALTARWLQLLDLGGVTASVLKGLALAIRDYGDLGVRPMADIDLLVAVDQATRALDLLEAAGWRDAGGVSRATLARLYHGSGLLHPDGGSLDVHWQLSGFLAREFEPRFEEIELGGRPAVTLDRTDTLVHVCLHGAWNGSTATTRWVADAVAVCRAAAKANEPLDRDRILAIGRAHGVGAILGTALGHIEHEHAAPLPEGLSRALLAHPAGWRLRRRQRVVTAPSGAHERLAGLAHLRAYWAYTRWGWDDRHTLRTFPTFLTELWGLDAPSALPAALVTRTAGRLRRR